MRLAKQNGRVIQRAQKQCNSYIDSYNKGVLQPQPGSTAAETLEAMITSELSGIREKVGEVRRTFCFVPCEHGSRKFSYYSRTFSKTRLSFYLLVHVGYVAFIFSFYPEHKCMHVCWCKLS